MHLDALGCGSFRYRSKKIGSIFRRSPHEAASYAMFGAVSPLQCARQNEVRLRMGRRHAVFGRFRPKRITPSATMRAFSIPESNRRAIWKALL